MLVYALERNALLLLTSWIFSFLVESGGGMGEVWNVPRSIAWVKGMYSYCSVQVEKRMGTG